MSVSFLFSSRRRHTRYIGDWSSDVCSSDLPRVHEPQINVHRAIHRPFVTPKKFSRSFWVVENFVQSVGALFAAENGQENAAAENWIDETSSVTGEQPAIAMEFCTAIRKICGGINFRYALRTRHSFGDDRLLGQRLFEEIFSAQFRSLKRIAIENDANAGALGRERDQPEPAIDPADQERERSVDSFGAPNAVVVRKDRQLLEMIVALFASKLRDENGIADARVDEITSANIFNASVSSNGKIDMFVEELNAIDRHFFMHFGAAFTRVIDQEFVEIRSRDLVSVVGLGTESVFEVKLRSRFRAGAEDFAAELFEETGAPEFLVQSEAGERFHAKRQQ